MEGAGQARRCRMRVFPRLQEIAHNATRRVRGSGSSGRRRRVLCAYQDSIVRFGLEPRTLTSFLPGVIAGPGDLDDVQRQHLLASYMGLRRGFWTIFRIRVC
jgi:hypothetical protein